jgi:Sec-independent protein translocase protein TatA
MAKKPTDRATAGNRVATINAVRSPLNLFTFGVLAMNGILVTLAYKAEGWDFTLLVIGALIGFLLIISMVFFVILYPQKLPALLGSSEGVTGRLRSLELSDNDIRFLIAFRDGASKDFEAAPNIGNVKSLEIRAEDLAKKGLIRISKGGGEVYYRPTQTGVELVTLIEDLARPLLKKP